MRKCSPFRQTTHLILGTYVVYITNRRGEQNVQKPSAYPANENIRLFPKFVALCVAALCYVRVCGEQTHSPVRFVCKRIVIQYFNNLMVILSVLRFQIVHVR